LRTSVGALAAGSLAIGRAAHAAGSDTIKLGLIGCGDRATGAAWQALHADKGTKLIAMADVFRDRAEGSRAQLVEQKKDQVAVDNDHLFVGFDGAQKVIESGVDAVLIACATRFHPEYTLAGIRAGKHVFVEKPHAIDAPGVHVVLEAAKLAAEKGLCLVSGLHRRYDPAVQETVKRIHDGAIGDIVSMEVSFMRAPYKVVERDPKWTEMEWQFRTWYHFNYLSGDDVPQSLIHTVDAACWAMKEEAPVTAHALAGRSASFEKIYGNVFDHAAVVYEFANGVPMYALVRTQNDCHGEVEVKIYGSKGRAREGVIEGPNAWTFQGPNVGGHQQEQIDFMAALRAGKIINNGAYMAKSTLTTVLGQMAAYTGKKLAWQQVFESKFTYPPHGPVSFEIAPPVLPDERDIYPVCSPGKTNWI
jgi:myo-inositol 2-dehydrogenase/D-chiro-inositol 1-dehydrogenase